MQVESIAKDRSDLYHLVLVLEIVSGEIMSLLQTLLLQPQLLEILLVLDLADFF